MDTIQNYNVQPVMLPILPASSPYLANPYNIDAAYSTSTQQLSIAMTITIPGDLNPNQVTIKQFYSSAQSSKLQFYAEYSSESSAQHKAIECFFKASPTDAGGSPIDLGAILSIFSMVVNAVGPKSSRGVNNTVRTTGT